VRPLLAWAFAVNAERHRRGVFCNTHPSCRLRDRYDLPYRRAFPAGELERGVMTTVPPSAPGRIFISYRREETAYPAGWLYDRLADHYGAGQVFKDVDSIGFGQ
jgi:hypothetical protein